jgi:hypothetical protein
MIVVGCLGTNIASLPLGKTDFRVHNSFIFTKVFVISVASVVFK